MNPVRLCMKFLVSDDDFDSRRLVQKILYPFGYVDVTTDGEEAVAAFQTALRDNDPYDLITLDIIMPNADGQQALREIREIEKERGIPPEKVAKIIMISGLDDPQEAHDAFFLGTATSYIIKPIRRQALLDEIRRLGLPLKEQET